MIIEMACRTWMDEDDEKVLQYLCSCDKWPSIENVVQETGVRRQKAEFALDMIRRQIGYAETRKKMKNWLDD